MILRTTFKTNCALNREQQEMSLLDSKQIWSVIVESMLRVNKKLLKTLQSTAKHLQCVLDYDREDVIEWQLFYEVAIMFRNIIYLFPIFNSTVEIIMVLV